MGIYLVSTSHDDWADDEVFRPTALALDAELTRRGLPTFTFFPGRTFEEKLYRPMAGFDRLCRSLTPDQSPLDWDLLLPVDLPDTLVLPVPSSYSDTTTVRAALPVLHGARALAATIELPVEHLPTDCANLDLCAWFDSPAVSRYPGPWQDDLDTAFYTALYLRAAEHALREGCPMHYS
ncbi:MULTISPECIES: hypothetical protein [unclassified Kitasatospora]|uniref:hypothetical protein n=1 Tax=unclassified Kitasatospora TaxID=2633591 RepID=UPI0007C8629F|nr:MULTISPECIES: hypothetical protein [unclassified Kitasatospora]